MRVRTVAVSLLLLAVLSGGVASGQAPAAAPPSQPATGVATPEQGQPTSAPSEPAKDTKDTTEFKLPPEKYKQAVEYSRAGYRLHFIEAAYGLIVVLIVLGLGFSAKFRDLAERASQRRFVQALIFVPLLIVTMDILSLPTALYRHSLALQYEQSIQGWGSWFWDWAKGEMVGIIIFTLLIWLLYVIVRRSPRRWWLYFWLASIPIIIFLLFITPVLIQPLFFVFEPLDSTQPALVTEIEKVVQRGGLEIPRERMYQMNASEKLKSVNAYVTGFGASKRVVVWDTTIKRMTTPQTLFVFGHEMGHYVLGHIPKLISMICVMLLVFLYLGYKGMHWIIGRWGQRWGVRAVDDWASLPILLGLISIFGFFSDPLTNTYSRAVEHEADIYGLEVTHGITAEPQKAAAEAFQILGEINLADPEPSEFIRIWLYDHPTVGERVVFSRNYDPWSKGEKPRFVPAP